MWITSNSWEKQGNEFFSRDVKNRNYMDKIILIQWESFENFLFHNTMHLCYYFFPVKILLRSQYWPQTCDSSASPCALQVLGLYYSPQFQIYIILNHKIYGTTPKQQEELCLVSPLNKAGKTPIHLSTCFLWHSFDSVCESSNKDKYHLNSEAITIIKVSGFIKT